MTEFPTVRVAAVQATPVILDASASVEKAIRLIEEAAGHGAQLVVLPETFVPLYPSNAWARGAVGVRRLGRAVGAVVGGVGRRPGPAGGASWRRPARGSGVWCAIGVNEREAHRPGSLYNALLLIGPEGLAHKHRKLMPTQHERLFHGIGEGRDLGVVETEHRPRRRADLLGEPDAARALRRLPRRAADLGRADRRRLRRLARLDAPHRDRVRRVRGLGAAVHPGRGVPRRLPGPDRPRARVRARWRGDRRAGGRAA